MKSVGILFLLFIVFSSCYREEKTINFKIKNNSDFSIDSLRIKLNNSSVSLDDKLFPNETINIELDYRKPEKLKGENIFIIYYFQKRKGYYSNFGYHSSPAFISEKYNLFIFNEGVSEIDRKTKHLRENKHEIDQNQS